MEYRQLGKTDLQISRIAMGCMSLKPGHPENEMLLKTALDSGINFFDTADLYDKGANEVLLGNAFAGCRSKVILATKVGNQWKEDGSGWDWNPRKAYILKAVEESLRRLRTDYIDLYQLHGGTLEDPTDETIDAFGTLVRQGKIRYYGISSMRPSVIRKWVSASSLSSVMIPYSLLDRRPEETVFPLLQEHNIGVLTRGSLAQGLLIDKPAKPYLNYTTEQVAQLQKAIKRSAPSNEEATQMALQFVLQHASVTATVAGIRTLTQLKAALSTGSITVSEALQELGSLLPVNQYEAHR
ncbi:MAG TPA: aldo/keto reductase [Flavisolibacter sp.]|jgi:aryl-alcohol dehydrogenase-like predicted oxidoreductase|nr:aldo/keto reductase [Flavisolibacter sp.]